MKKLIAICSAVVVMAACVVGGCAAYYVSSVGSSLDIAKAAICSTTPGVLPGMVPSPYNSIFTAASAQWKIDPVLQTAIFMSEHGNTWPNPKGPWASSPVGAKGPFQFMDGTWLGYSNSNPQHPNGDVEDLTDAAYAAAHYLSDLGGKPNMQPGNPDNPLPGTVARVAGGYNNMDHAYMVNAVQQFLKYKRGTSATSSVNAALTSSGSSVYVLGDSIALGANQQLNDALSGTFSSGYINASRNRSITGAGVTPGFRTSGLKALQEDAYKKEGNFQGVSKATAIVIELGTNDLHGGAAFESRIRTLIGKIRRINAQATIYWVEVFSRGPVDRRSLNNSIESLASTKGYTPIKTVGQGIHVGSHGVHPTNAGDSVLAHVIASHVSGQGGPDLVNGNPAIQGSNPGCAPAGGIVLSPNGYTSPFPVKPTITRAIDQGVDYHVPVGTPLRVIGNAQVVHVISFYRGQPSVIYRLLDGSLKDKCIYYSEQVTGTPGTSAFDSAATSSLQAEIGNKPIPAGHPIAYMATSGTNLEFGFADCASGNTLAKSTGGYHENDSTAAGVSFNKLMVALGLPSDSPYPTVLGSVAGRGYP
jgi:hypothetical protein